MRKKIFFFGVIWIRDNTFALFTGIAWMYSSSLFWRPGQHGLEAKLHTKETKALITFTSF